MECVVFSEYSACLVSLGFPGQLASNVNVIESFEGRLRSKLRPLFVSFTGVTGKPYFQLNDAFRRPLTVKLCFAGFPLATYNDAFSAPSDS